MQDPGEIEIVLLVAEDGGPRGGLEKGVVRGQAGPDAQDVDDGGVLGGLVEAGLRVRDLVLELTAYGLQAFEDGGIGGLEAWFDAELEDFEDGHLRVWSGVVVG